MLNLEPGMYNLNQLKWAIINANATPATWEAVTAQVASMTPAEVANVVGQVDGITFARNSAGEIIGAWYDTGAVTAAPSELGAISEAALINSNTASAASRTATLAIPQNATINATTGAVEMQAGSTAVATGTKVSTVLGHIGTAVVGSAIGLKLGVWIDGALYNANPEFWDSHNLSEMNPETWNQTKVTNWLYDYSGYDDFIAMIDENGQPYIDENVFAMYAQYMASQGFFNNNYASEKTPEVVSVLEYPDYNYPDPVPYTGNVLIADEQNILVGEGNGVYGYFAKSGSSYYSFCLCSKNPFTAHFQNDPIIWNPNEFVYGDNHFYHLELVRGTTDILPGMPAVYLNDPGNWSLKDVSYIILFGNQVQVPVPGVHEYDTIPTGITPTMTIPDIINLLKQQYPELWDNAIKNGTLQDDGTITDKIYVPIGVPTGGTDTQPTTDPEHSGQPDPENEPQTTIINKVIQKTPQPPKKPEDSDTGTGNTPPVVLPTGSADALYKIYNPTNAQIQSFGGWLWSSNFVDQLLKVFNDPMQAIISLHKIYASPHIGGSTTIKVGYLDSNVPSDFVDQQYIDVDCGSVNLLEKTASVYDYEPFVDVRLYLPFIGIVSLSTADVMRSQIHVKYRVDVITGTLVAFVEVKRDLGAGGVIYQYTGSCCEAYPLSSGSYMGILTGVLGIAAGVVGTIASGGLAAPALLGGAAGLTAMHTKVEHSNGFSGNAGAMACKKPYLIISRQQSAMSNGVSGQGGYPANTYVKLDQCDGFTKVKYCHLTGISGATDTELDEIESLLKEGVIV